MGDKAFDIQVSDRTGLATNPVRKLAYLMGKVLPNALSFNLVFRGGAGLISILAGVLGIGCLIVRFLRSPSSQPFSLRLVHTLCIPAAFALIYLPSLMVQENYASNRTCMALYMAVCMWVLDTLLRWVDARGKGYTKNSVVWGISGILVLAGLYNFRCLFLRPAVDEYTAMQQFIDTNWQPGMTSVDFIRAEEGFARDHYGIASSWDEFGMSSSYFKWVPELLVKQLVFEKTGDRAAASQITIRSWDDEQAWRSAGGIHSPGSLWMDAAAILR